LACDFLGDHPERNVGLDELATSSKPAKRPPPPPPPPASPTKAICIGISNAGWD
jgi:hypothetical protein